MRGENYLLIGPNESGKVAAARRIACRTYHATDRGVRVRSAARSRVPSGPITQGAAYRAAGIGTPEGARGPFRAPHHTCSVQALAGLLYDLCEVHDAQDFGHLGLAAECIG